MSDDRLRKDAQKALAKGDLGAALAAYNELLKQNPGDTKLWVAVGDICLKLGQKAKAIQIYEKAAQQYSLACELVQAINLNKKILAIDKHNERAHKQIKILQSRSQIERAAKQSDDTVYRWHQQRQGVLPGADVYDNQAISFSGTADEDELQVVHGASNEFLAEHEAPRHVPAGSNDTGAPSLEAWLLGGRGDAPPLAESASSPELLALTGEVTQRIMAREVDADIGRRAQAEALAAAQKFPLFAGIDAKAWERLRPHCIVLRYNVGDVVVSEGAAGEALFVVVDGSLVELKKDFAGRSVELGVLQPGDALGETALLSNAPQPTSVVADHPATVVEIDRDGVADLAARYPRFQQQLDAAHRRRLTNILLKINPVFQAIPPDKRMALLKRCEPLKVEPRTVVVSAHQRADALYFVLAGRLGVYVRGGTRGAKRVATLKEADFCGETTWLLNTDELAAFAADQPSRLLKLDGKLFRQLLEQWPTLEQQLASIAERRLAVIRKALAG